MASNDYVFIAHWDVPDDIARVYEISIDVENYRAGGHRFT